MLLIVDECSMVDKTLGEDLLSFGKPILVLGDPAQLPPVYGEGFFTKAAPTPCITAGTETLFRQAPMTAHDYMLKAIHDIDELLGKGYAKQHSELIAAYMQTAAIDFGAAIIARAIEGISGALEGIEFTLRHETISSLAQSFTQPPDGGRDA